MEDARPEKMAVVEEVRERLASSAAAVLTEYRGLSVAELADLRRSLAEAGGEYKVYKNTLVRRAVSGSPHQAIEPLLEGPTAIAFVSGEISGVAKALRDFSRSNPNLVLKGGILSDSLLSASDLAALADLPSRDVLLARFAGALAAPMQQMAGLLQALPRNLAYGLSALLKERSASAPAATGVADKGPAAPEASAGGPAAPEVADEGPAAPEASAGGPAAPDEGEAGGEAPAAEEAEPTEE